MTKTFTHVLDLRFPSDEAAKTDASGLNELIQALKTCARALDVTRLEIGSWTTTGIVRTGNEDAFSLVHHTESRQDDFSESALILLADGMGGYEAGEVAASMALKELKQRVSENPQFRGLNGQTAYATELPNPQGQGNHVPPANVEQMKEFLKNALQETNKVIFEASRSGQGRRGMGCTAEAVFLNGRHLIVGHVGDSRTYHFRDGQLTQLTRDHTLVNRLVELGQLSPEEAEDHPRKNELQQALGGQPSVEPGTYDIRLKAGDVIVVCSDGLNGHVNDRTLRDFLLDEAFSAEVSARRLVNLTNIYGATDNTTVVVIRAT